MAINPHNSQVSQKTSLRQNAVKRVSQVEFSLPAEEPHPTVSMESATREFGQALQQLSAADKQEIQKIQAQIDVKHANDGPKRLGRLLVGVMNYSHKRLSYLEQNKAAAQPGECEKLERVFTNGMNLVEAFAALPD
jgi:hypothetical protein